MLPVGAVHAALTVLVRPSSLWTSRTAGERRCPPTTAAAARGASTPRRPRCRGAAAAAAATRPASPPSVPPAPRTAAPARQRTCSTIVIKVRVGSPTWWRVLQGLAHYTSFVLDHYITFFLLLNGGIVKDWLI